jgi:hypothetical protein
MPTLLPWLRVSPPRLTLVETKRKEVTHAAPQPRRRGQTRLTLIDAHVETRVGEDGPSPPSAPTSSVAGDLEEAGASPPAPSLTWATCVVIDRRGVELSRHEGAELATEANTEARVAGLKTRVVRVCDGKPMTEW